ncbi:hypothetical protein J7S95_20015 [Providencia stuartii]|uniref:hypothetical protein n=1 Tax=Providencia stuartii TaxID=588 RepID=UPI001B6EC8A6|nr:hypothetical protein [Providencia stuartii]MBQ0458968.1 hypothetical protein [Providencia stuartii]
MNDLMYNYNNEQKNVLKKLVLAFNERNFYFLKNFSDDDHYDACFIFSTNIFNEALDRIENFYIRALQLNNMEHLVDDMYSDLKYEMSEARYKDKSFCEYCNETTIHNHNICNICGS